MGKYLNPGNEGFRSIRRGEYIDKTGLIGYINGTLGTKQKLTCVNRPRRFGKESIQCIISGYYLVYLNCGQYKRYG